MLKMLGSLILFVLMPVVSLACSITANDKVDGRKCIDVGGYQLYAHITGASGPTVIFDAGLGDDSTVWKTVTSQVAAFAHIVVFDRAGLGKSDSKPGNGPISAQDSVDALNALLKKENIKPPYILVGHSRGGLNMQLFAQEHPTEVTGMVLIDSVSRNQTIHDPAPLKTSPYYREAIAFDESRIQISNAGNFPAIPLIILTATNHHQGETYEKLWQTWQKEMVRLSPKGTQIFAYGSDHYIQKQQPQLVVDAIYTIIHRE